MNQNNYYRQLGLSDEELDTLKEAFQLYDVKKNGYISTEQFSHILLELGIVDSGSEAQDQQLAHIIQSADINHDNKIDFNEFVLAMFHYMPHNACPQQQQINYNSQQQVFSEKDTNDEELMACFQFFDQDHDGRISQKELEQVMIRFDTHLTPRELKEMMSTADINRDGFIDFEEFKQLLPPL
ncbi:calmodulin-like [Mucor ambiguus]|uniref:Calmodulin-like n=1 Tax=Mucor ambiguus TaxID=91626 RepID=A0A0C9MZH5_9FUNG|nr:calmodulin-like [Mucor ambiguus]